LNTSRAHATLFSLSLFLSLSLSLSFSLSFLLFQNAYASFTKKIHARNSSFLAAATTKNFLDDDVNDECRKMSAKDETTAATTSTLLAIDNDNDDEALRSFVETLTLKDEEKKKKNAHAPTSDTFSLPPCLDYYLDQLLRNSSSDEDEEGGGSCYETRDGHLPPLLVSSGCLEQPEKRKKKRLKSCLELIMNHEEEHYLPSSPPEEEAQRNNTMLMHDEKQEGILRFMNRDKDIDVWGVCMSDATRANNPKRKSNFNFEDEDDEALIPSGNFFSSDDTMTISVTIPDQTKFPLNEEMWRANASKKEPDVAMKDIKKKRSLHAVPKSNRRAKPQNPSRTSQMRGAAFL
jgi:hypothetical protein